MRAKRLICLAVAAVLLLAGGCAAKKDNSADKGAFRLLFLGDTQSANGDPAGYGALADIVSAAASDGTFDAVLLAGDLVTDETNDAEWEAFFAAMEPLSKYPLYAAAGNHTQSSGFFDRFDFPGGLEKYPKHFFSVDIGAARVAVLDSNLLGNTTEPVVSEISQWLAAELSETDKPLKIVVQHHPVYVVSSADKDVLRAESIKKNYLPIMQQNGVKLLLCGHQHVFSRTYPLTNGARDEKLGITQLMGVAGEKSYSIEQHDYLAVTDAENVYTVVEYDGSALILTTKTAAGATVDEYTIII